MFGEDCAISEIAEALDLHPDTAHNQIAQAVTLVARHPATLQAWEAGRITGLQAAALVHKTACFGDDIAKATTDTSAWPPTTAWPPCS